MALNGCVIGFLGAYARFRGEGLESVRWPVGELVASRLREEAML